MSPRKRIIDDRTVLAAAARVVERHGAEHVRVADVAVESGLAPATLIQRFGTREALLDGIGATFVAAVGAAFRAPASPLAKIAAAVADLPLRAHLRFFAVRPLYAQAYSIELRKQIGLCLAAAVEVGELAPCDVAGLARRIQIELYGRAAADMLEGQRQEIVLKELLGEYA